MRDTNNRQRRFYFSTSAVKTTLRIVPVNVSGPEKNDETVHSRAATPKKACTASRALFAVKPAKTFLPLTCCFKAPHFWHF